MGKVQIDNAALCNVIVCWMALSCGGALSPTGRLLEPLRRHPVIILATIIAL